MKGARLLGGVLALLGAQAAMADVSALVFGASKHYGCTSNKRFDCKFDEFNPGLGVEWSTSLDEWGRAFVRGGAYRDSYGDAAGFVGGGWRKEWNLGDKWRVGGGAMVGALGSQHYDGVFLQPMLSVGYDKVTLEVGYVPDTSWGNDKKHHAKSVMTFMLRYDFF